MKKYLSILAFSCLTLCSCDNFLDLTPQSVLTPENAYEKPEDWQQTLYAAYGTLQEVFVGKYTITLTEFGTDEVIPFDMGWAAYSQLHYYTFSASHEFLDNHYRLCYEGIKRCNAVIDMPSDAVSADLHNSMIMQARFLRAIYYFDLVRMYGGVPLWTKSSIDRSEIMRPRATVDEVYTLITQDMEAALGLPTSWPNAQDKGRATSYAAQALLARIYLQWGKPEEALKYCRMLEGKFKLYDNLKDIFDPKNKNQEYENIFEIQFKHSGSWGLEGSIQHSYWGPRNVGGPTNFGGWGGFGPTQYLYDSYDNNDKRKKAFFITEYAGVGSLGKKTKPGRTSGHVCHGRGLMGNRYGRCHSYVWKNISRFRELRILCTEHPGDDGSGTFSFLPDRAFCKKQQHVKRDCQYPVSWNVFSVWCFCSHECYGQKCPEGVSVSSCILV